MITDNLTVHRCFSPNIDNLFSITGRGNETSCAEFNFYSDAEAAHIVLSSFKCPIVVVPWEPIIEAAFSLVKLTTDDNFLDMVE